jgi:hypothetical protein
LRSFAKGIHERMRLPQERMMKIVRVVVLTLLVAAFVSAKPRSAAAADSLKGVFVGGLIGAGVGMVVALAIHVARHDSAAASLDAPTPHARTAFDLTPSPSREAVPTRNTAWASGTIVSF